MTRTDMSRIIVGFEARRGADGRIRPYTLPANDGGAFGGLNQEYAGLNPRYDGPELRKILALYNAGKHTEAENMAVEVIALKTDAAAGWVNLSREAWTGGDALELFYRDTIFNRGPTGAAKIIQMAAGVPVDGAIGPQTRAAMATLEKRPLVFLARLRGARERYEREIVGYRANFWNGLISRFDLAFEAAAKVIA